MIRVSLFLLAATLLTAGEAALRLDGRTITGPRQTIAIAASGLPEQITIGAAPGELLVEGDDPRTVGRGPQLRGPIRLVATIAGKAVVADAATPSTATVAGGGVDVRGQLAAGSLRLDLTVRYSADGGIALEVKPSGAACDALDLVIEPDGRPDFAISGPVLDAKPRAYAAAEFLIPAGTGPVWSNLGGKGLRAAPGLPASWFVGDGDRGLALFPQDDAAAWGLDPAQPSMLMERDQAGAITLRLHLANKPGTPVPAARRILLVALPAALPAADRLRRTWLDEAPAAPATPATRETASGALRADIAALYGRPGSSGVLLGPAGGAPADGGRDLVATFPPALSRFLAGTHTGLAFALRPTATTRGGMAPAGDRIALGRALVDGIGLDAAGLGQPGEALRTVTALQRFGALGDDAKTAFVPWWRSAALLRYGNPAKADDAFATTTDDPLARVRVAAYRRPGKEGVQVLIVVLNENDAAVRDVLYLPDAARLLGGRNRLTGRGAAAAMDRSGVPAGSDWEAALAAHRSDAGGKAKGSEQVLVDAEDGGVVQLAASDGALEGYGPLHVPARSFRLLLATGKP